VLLDWIKCDSAGREKAIAAIHSMRPERSTNLMAGITTGAHRLPTTATLDLFMRPPTSASHPALPHRRPSPWSGIVSPRASGFSQFEKFTEPDDSLSGYALSLIITTDGMPSSQWHPARGRDGYKPLVKTLSKGLGKKRGGNAACPNITTIGIGFQLVRRRCRPRPAQRRASVATHSERVSMKKTTRRRRTAAPPHRQSCRPCTSLFMGGRPSGRASARGSACRS
jgi:hypothetical protein